MELRQLEYFQVLVEEMNLARAAERCHITQQALSKSMRSLAAEYGSELFYRDHGRLKLTEFGKHMYKEVGPLLLEARRIERILHAQSAQQKGRIRIACSVGVLKRELEAYMKKEKKEHPELDLQFVELPDVFCEQYVREEKCDLGFSIGLPEERNAFDCTLYMRNRLCAVVWKDHPLAKKKSICMKDLCGTPVLLKNETYRSHEVFTQQMQKQKMDLSLLYNSEGFLPSTLAARPDHVGIGTMYLKIDHKDYACIPFEEEELNWDIYIIVKKGHYMSETAKQFLKELYSFSKNLCVE